MCWSWRGDHWPQLSDLSGPCLGDFFSPLLWFVHHSAIGLRGVGVLGEASIACAEIAATFTFGSPAFQASSRLTMLYSRSNTGRLPSWTNRGGLSGAHLPCHGSYSPQHRQLWIFECARVMGHGTAMMGYGAMMGFKLYGEMSSILFGWWFGTFLIFPYIGNNRPNWPIFFRGVETTNHSIIYIICCLHWIVHHSTSFSLLDLI